ncbi:MAG: hypothetical protein KIT84_14145 [Labilithrix sp.]|nr:hypothetical protein [Labilithrix sp.]MCW5812162.1 hypothetical protein [Labilithrix sp.]
MRILTMEDWPYAVRYLMTAAQNASNANGHAMTSPAHLSAVLYEMPPVRAIVGERISAKAIEASVLVEQRGGAKKALFTKYLEELLTGPAPRSTQSFLERYATGHPTAAKNGLVFAAFAEAIAAVLDTPRLESVIREPASKELFEECPVLAVAFVLASKNGHAFFGHRHVLLAAIHSFDKALRAKGKPALEDELARITELVDRTTPKRAPTDMSLYATPRLFGILAQALTDGGDAFGPKLTERCANGDDALAPLMEALRAAVTRLREGS